MTTRKTKAKRPAAKAGQNLKAEIARRIATDPLLSEPPRYRHPTWGGFMQEGGAGVQWIIGATDDWRIRYEALRDRAGDVADDGHEAANRRKAAERLKGLVATYLALATPAPGLALQILRGDAALKHIEATDRTGLEMQALALRLGLASVDTPVYVSVQTVRSEYLERMQARQMRIAKEAVKRLSAAGAKPSAPVHTTIDAAADYITAHPGSTTATVCLEACDKMERTSFLSHISPTLRTRGFCVTRGCNAAWYPPETPAE